MNKTMVKAKKKILTLAAAILTAVLTLIALTAVSFSESRDIYYCDGTMQGNPRMFNSYSSVAFRFQVPDGYKLDTFTLLACPTWDVRDNAGFTARMYVWAGTYADTVSSVSFASTTVSHHVDNQRIDLTFDYVPAGTYLMVLSSFTDVIGTWEYMALPAEYVNTWAYYQDGIEEWEYLPGTKITVSTDKNPKEIVIPTATPTKGPDTEEVVTEAPEETPHQTRERITAEPTAATSDANKKNPGLAAGIIIAAVLTAATAGVILFVISRDKKNGRS